LLSSLQALQLMSCLYFPSPPCMLHDHWFIIFSLPCSGVTHKNVDLGSKLDLFTSFTTAKITIT
jgi:hypothetical protein